jgi:hypothetical protein
MKVSSSLYKSRILQGNNVSGGLMTHEEILQEITSLPLEGQRQVIDFIAFVRQRYGQTQLNEKTALNTNTESFVGMWQDRDDLKDSSEWVRRIRETEWTR